MKTKLFSLFVALICATQVLAYDFESNGIYYNITSNSTVEVTHKEDSQYSPDTLQYVGTVNIPEKVTYDGNTYSVTRIDDSAFFQSYELIKVTIPNSVQQIGYSAFSNCRKLESVNIPEGVAIIESTTFYCCYALTSITIPNTVKSIRRLALASTGLESVVIPNSVDSLVSAFNNCSKLRSMAIGSGLKSIGLITGCSNLESITVDAANPNYYSVDNCVIEKASKTLVLIGKSSAIPTDNSVTGIGDYVFAYRSDLTSFTLPDNITRIGSGAFYYCTNLTTINLPNNLTTMGSAALGFCTALKSISIPHTCTNIGGGIFYECNNLETITATTGNGGLRAVNNCLINTHTKTLLAGCKNSVLPDDNSIVVLGDSAFYVCRGLTEVNIPASVTKVGNSVFGGCYSLKTLILSNNITEVGHSLLRSCGRLETVVLPESMDGIGTDFFAYCSKLKSVTIPEGVTYIGNGAFRSCSSLQSLTIPNSVDSIGDGAFDQSGLQSLTIPDNVKYLGEQVCYYAQDLQTVTIGASVPEIKYSAFSDCSNLQSITIGNSVAAIDEWAFSGCTSLTSITLPKSLRSIGTRAFRSVPLASLTIPENVKVIDEAIMGYGNESLQALTILGADSVAPWAFEGCQNLETVTLGKNVKVIGQSMFIDCPKLRQVTGGEGLIEIGDHAFRRCYALESIAWGNKLQRIGECAFYDCTNLQAIQMPNTVTDLGRWAFYGCSGLKTANISTQVKTLRKSIFCGCNSLTSIVLPADVDSIYEYAFSECESLKTITSKSATPPIVSKLAFRNIPVTSNLIVPCGTADVYQQAENWAKPFASITESFVWDLTILSADETQGTVEITQAPTCANDATAIFKATAKEGYEFEGWSDGNTENPRTVEVLDDIKYVANFISTTGVENLASESVSTVQKIYENGTIYIFRNGEKYTIDGRKVE